MPACDGDPFRVHEVSACVPRTLTSFTCTFIECNVAHAKTYESGCKVSACKTGWRVSANKAQCDPNVCTCDNGEGATGAKCVTHGNERCESCNDDFRLDSGTLSCTGTVF